MSPDDKVGGDSLDWYHYEIKARENPVKSVFHCKFTFFTGFSGDFDGEFSLVFHGENAMKISWKKHEKTLNICHFMAHEKPLTNRKPMK